MSEGNNRIDSLMVLLWFCLISNFGSFVTDLRKPSIYLKKKSFFYFYMNVCFVGRWDEWFS